MATVYLARDLKHDRPVAIKVLRPELAALLGAERFLREIRITAVLQHPHILALIDSGAERDSVYYVMPYIAGENLRGRLLRERRLPVEDALRITRAVASALEFAHRQGIVHRDVKPENILLHQEEPLVADFGIARAVGGSVGSDRLTEAGITLGTPAYMSPEQCTGDAALDGRSDEYSLACVLYEMLAGEPPYIGATAQAILAKQLTERPPRLGAARGGTVPPTVDAAVSRALAKAPADRFATVGEFAAALGESTRAPRFPARAAIAAALMLGVTTVAVVAWNLRTRVPPPRATAPAPAVTPRRAIAVLGFQNLSGRRAEAWLSTALSEMLTTELAAGEELRTIPGEDVAQMKINLSLPDADSYGRATLARIHQNLGADDVVLGSFVPLGGGQIRLDLRLQDALAGETLTAISEKGSETAIDDLVSRAGATLRRTLGAGELSASAATAARASLPSNPQAARLYAEGLAKLRLFDALGARALLERAVAADPNHALAHAALAGAWWSLGYREKASEAARRAFELSTDLSREDRLSIEGRYRQMTAQWDRAIEIYRALFAFFPDNVDYGLDLAKVETDAARPKDALSTVAALRSLSPPLRDDVRIDLAEAGADEALGDFKGEQAAAARAAEQAKLRGARLMLASAHYMETWALDFLGDLDGAAATATEARQIYAAAGDRAGVGRALNIMGTILLDKGDLAGALRMSQDATAIAEATGNKGGMAVALHQIANVQFRQGNLSGAQATYQRALAVFREIGNKRYEVMTLASIAGVLHDQGDLARALQMYRQALTMLQAIGDESAVEETLNHIANTLAEQGELARAESTYERALALSGKLGTKSGAADALSGLGQVLTAAGALPQARQAYTEALAIRTADGEKTTAAESEVALAELSIEEGHPDRAESPLRAALEVFRGEHLTDDEIVARTLLSRSLVALGRLAQAREEVDSAGPLAGRSQNRDVRLRFAITAARVHEDSARVAAALAESAKCGLLGVGYEARLALGEIEMETGQSAAGRARLLALEKDAAAKGFSLVARKAHGATTFARPGTVGESLPP